MTSTERRKATFELIVITTVSRIDDKLLMTNKLHITNSSYYHLALNWRR